MKLNKEVPTVLFSSVSEDQETLQQQTAELCRRICELGEEKDEITVGVVGYPKVGKKSLLAVLSKHLSNETKKIKLLPRPGVAFAAAATNSVIVKHVADPEDLTDPYVPVHALIKKVPKNEMLMLYEIADYKNTQEFLANVATKAGHLLKGGAPDYDQTARMVLNDWITGKIKYYQECEESE